MKRRTALFAALAPPRRMLPSVAVKEAPTLTGWRAFYAAKAVGEEFFHVGEEGLRMRVGKQVFEFKHVQFTCMTNLFDDTMTLLP